MRIRIRPKLGNTLLYIIRIPMAKLYWNGEKNVSFQSFEMNVIHNRKLFTGLLLCNIFYEVKQFLFYFRNVRSNHHPQHLQFIRIPENLMMQNINNVYTSFE